MSSIDDTSRRYAAARTLSLVGALLAVLVALMVNYLGFRHFERWDWTSAGIFTLSAQTDEVLARLDRPVDVYVFLSDGEREFDDVRELLDRYKAKSTQIQVQHVDPDRERGEYQLLAERFEIGTFAAGAGLMADVALVVQSGERRWKVTREDLLEQDFSGDSEGGPRINVKSERALTGAIVQVTTGRATKVCVTRGHGEWEVSGAGERNLGFVRDELRRNNIELESIDTLGQTGVAEGCDAVFVVSPTRAFSEQEAQLLDGYVRGGGNLFLALDPVFDDDRVQITGLEDTLREMGVVVGRDVVLEMDASRRLSPSPTDVFVAVDYGEHDTTTALQGRGPVALFMARSVTAAPGGGATELFRTSPDAFAATNLARLAEQVDLAPEGDDVQGPVGLAAAASVATRQGDDEPAGGRVVVVGDADFLQTAFLGEPQFANIDVLSAFTGWLTARQELISIAPRSVDAQAIVMTDDALSGVAFRVMGLMPLAAMLMGFAVWWSRRS